MGDANNKSDNLTAEKSKEILDEIKKEIKELNEEYEVKEHKL
ncbi:hypothetical protein [Methanobrevibacter sp.]|nr:hypothetical protein [Methanobrevibacter sp.]